MSERDGRPGRFRELRIRDLGVIDDAVVELADGLNVLTGETGAGKTMVVSGLGLLLGARADAALIRGGAKTAVVEGTVELAAGHPALARAVEAGADIEDGLLLTRSVGADGRSRAYVGGRTAPVSVLTEVGRHLVAVHGQADQWRLRRPDQHRALLDGYGGAPLQSAAQAYRRVYDEAARVRADVARLEELDRDRLVQAAVLRAGLEDLEALDPHPGEDEDLAVEEERLAYADALRTAAGRAHALLTGDDPVAADAGPGTAGAGAAELLAQARSALTAASGHDPRLAELGERVAELAYLAADVGAEVASYVDGLEGDPNRLAWVQQRRADLTRLTRAYGGTVDAALAWGAQAAVRLAGLESVAEQLESARARLGALSRDLGQAAGRLSTDRKDAAGRLAAAIGAELAQLAMPHAVVEVVVSQPAAPPGEAGLVVPGRDGALRCGPHGVDDVEIRLAANPGAPPRTVAKAASGGELSRVMLAIEVVTHLAEHLAPAARAASAAPATAAAHPADPRGTPRRAETAHPADTGEPSERGLTTFVFDEVDAGVGGAAALAIGARLAALARHTQVVVVTHLAQVAAYADRHICIHKTTGAGAATTAQTGAEPSSGPGPGDGSATQVTTSDLTVLDEAGRLRELARMMAGSADSEVAIEHARELLTTARAEVSRHAAAPGSSHRLAEP